MTDDLYYRKLEIISTTDLVDMIRERDKRIAELEEDIQNLEGIKLAQETALSTEYIIEEQLQKENAELKDDNKVMADNYSKMEQKFYISLTEAKAIIKDYIIVATADHCEVCSVPEENRCINVLKLNEQAEQFLEATE